jgi:hypothetical protein
MKHGMRFKKSAFGTVKSSHGVFVWQIKKKGL